MATTVTTELTGHDFPRPDREFHDHDTSEGFPLTFRGSTVGVMSLTEQAKALQDEARQLMDQLDLPTAFGWQPHLIGSALSGLMVVRDLDIMFDAPDATAAAILEGLATLAHRVDLRSVDFRDERGDRRPTPAITDERFYAVLHTDIWKIDLTFWLHVVERPHVWQAERLRGAPEAQRLTILQLKDQCPEVESSDIYAAVLERGVRTVEELKSAGRPATPPDGRHSL
jgi:hypothetical protein